MLLLWTILIIENGVALPADPVPATAGPQEGDTTVLIDTQSTSVAKDGCADTARTPPEKVPGPNACERGGHGEDLVVVKENLDTVFIFDKSVFRHVARDWRNNIDIFRRRGYGLSGSSHFGANAILIRPVKDYIKSFPELANKGFDFRGLGFEPFLMTGGSIYVGLGEGFRLGGSGMVGTHNNTSRRYNGDSVLVLNTSLVYGGFLIEKCILSGNWNFSAGGTLGGGSFRVSVAEQKNDYFFRDDDWEEIIGEDDDGRKSVFFLMEPHCSVSYTFFHFFHAGLSVTAPAFMSLEKFNAYTDDYFTVNPGVKIMLIFGNLG